MPLVGRQGQVLTTVPPNGPLGTTPTDGSSVTPPPYPRSDSDTLFGHSNTRAARITWEPNWEPTVTDSQRHAAMVGVNRSS